MNINKASWDEVREQIELSLQEDSNITNVIVNYQVRETSKSKNILTNRLEMLSLERKSLNEQMRDVKKNIKFYEELDCSQLKAF